MDSDCITIGGIMVSMLLSDVVDHGFELLWGQTKDYEIGVHQVSNFSALSLWEQVTYWWDGDDVCFVLDQDA
jgi:hypothetical protein